MICRGSSPGTAVPRQFLKRYLRDPQALLARRGMKVLGPWLHEPNLWHLNRRSASGAFAVGLFSAFIPIPMHTLLAAGIAIAIRVNLPIAVALVWVNNPLTMPPMFYFCYRLGEWILGRHNPVPHFELSLTWLQTGLVAIWQPFLLGCLLAGTASAALGYATVRGLWRLSLVRHYRRRKLRRKMRAPV